SGNVRTLTNATGTVIGTAQYDPFGGTRAQSGTQLPLGFLGGLAAVTDGPSGLIMGPRGAMDPITGRRPAGSAGGVGFPTGPVFPPRVASAATALALVVLGITLMTGGGFLVPAGIGAILAVTAVYAASGGTASPQELIVAALVGALVAGATSLA